MIPQRMRQTALSAPDYQLGAQPEHVGRLQKARINQAFGGARPNTDPQEGEGEPVSQVRAVGPNPGIVLRALPPSTHLIGFITEQRWQGYVTSLTERTFYGILYDTAGDEVEEVEFERAEVPEAVRHLIAPGAIFFWDIGFQVDPGGQRVRQSALSVPMIPPVTDQQLAAAKERAAARFKELGWGRREQERKDTPRP